MRFMRGSRVHPLLPTLSATALSTALAVPVAESLCIVIESDASISLEIAPGTNALVELYVDGANEGGAGADEASRDRRCRAEVFVPLSVFPTSSLAIRPLDVARSLGDVVRAAGATSCEVWVAYDNDTDAVYEEHELCLKERFRFGARRYWSVESETFCWEPDEEA